MNFTCDKCQRRYSIPDDKVRGRTVRVRCKNCQNPITLRGDKLDALEGSRATLAGPIPAAASAPTRAAPVSAGGDWYVMIRGQQVGPLSERDLHARVVSGEATPKSFFWKKGMAEWKRGAELSALASLLAGEPPAEAEPPPPPAPTPIATRAATPARVQPQGVVPESLARAQTVQTTAALSELPEERQELFSDASDGRLRLGDSPAYEPSGQPAKKKKRKEEAASSDPFAALGDIDPSKLPPPGEATQFFIAQAGVNKRNPPWKIALFVGAWVAVPVVVVYLLASLEVVPLEVKRIDESTGQEVTESVFSQGVVSGIGDLLSGKTIKAKQEVERSRSGGSPKRVAGKAADAQPPEGPSGATRPTTSTQAPSNVNLADFYGEKKDRGPTLRKDVEVRQKDGAGSGPEAEAVAKVVSASQSAFQFCVEQELKKNPGFKGGKIMITTTIGSSGVVKSATIDRRDIDGSALGECLKGKARRMMFASFEGEDLEVEFPLMLTSTM